MLGIIYKYTSPSNKCYIGQTVQHIGDYQRGKPKSEEFKRLQSERMKQNNPMKNPDSVKKMLKTRNNI